MSPVPGGMTVGPSACPHSYPDDSHHSCQLVARFSAQQSSPLCLCADCCCLTWKRLLLWWSSQGQRMPLPAKSGADRQHASWFALANGLAQGHNDLGAVAELVRQFHLLLGAASVDGATLWSQPQDTVVARLVLKRWGEAKLVVHAPPADAAALVSGVCAWLSRAQEAILARLSPEIL